MGRLSRRARGFSAHVPQWEKPLHWEAPSTSIEQTALAHLYWRKAHAATETQTAKNTKINIKVFEKMTFTDEACWQVNMYGEATGF